MSEPVLLLDDRAITSEQLLGLLRRQGQIPSLMRELVLDQALESVEISEAAQHFCGYSAGDGHSNMQVPMAIWPFTSRNQICGDYQPCNLEESVRRSRLRAAPLI